MLSHEQAAPLLARRADGGLDDDERAAVDAHLERCAPCQAEARAQQAVVAVLRGRLPAPVPAGLAARIAAEIALEAGWLGVADWRGWSFRLAPLAAGLVLAAFLWGGGAAPATEPVASLAPIVDTWMMGDEDGLPATSVFWQQDVTADTLLSTVLRSAPDDVIESEGEAEDVPK